MTLIDKFFKREERSTITETFSTSWGGSTVGVSTFTAEAALRHEAVWSCVRLLSDDIAQLPLNRYVKSGESRLSLPSPSWIDRPNPDTNRFEFFQQLVTSLALFGNAYAFILRNQMDEITELWPLSPDRVRIERYRGGKVYTIDGDGAFRQNVDILHIRFMTLPGADLGLSPIAHARTQIEAGVNADNFAAAFWLNGANPGLILSVDANTSDEDAKAIRKQLTSEHTGSRNAHKSLALKGEVKVHRMALPPEESQFLETRQYSTAQIARWFGVPPSKIGDYSNSSYKNQEEQAKDYQAGLMPWLARIEASFNDLLAPGEFVKFNEKVLVRGDLKSEAEAFRIYQQEGDITVNEVRAKLDLAPIDDPLADMTYKPLNFAAVGQMKPMTEQEKASMIVRMVGVGFIPSSVIEALESGDYTKLTHSGITPTSLAVPYAPETEGLNISEALAD